MLAARKLRDGFMIVIVWFLSRELEGNQRLTFIMALVKTGLKVEIAT